MIRAFGDALHGRENVRHATLLFCARSVNVQMLAQGKAQQGNMNKSSYFTIIGFCISGLLICGCPSNDTDDSTSGTVINSEAKTAVRMFNGWVRSGSEPNRMPTRRITPEDAMGLVRPEELSTPAYEWIKATKPGDYYRQSREQLAVLYKKLMDDYKVRKDSGVGPSDYTNELMRNWHMAYKADYDLRNFIVECYSRRELRPLPRTLAQYFGGKEAAMERFRTVVNNLKQEIQRLSSKKASLKSGLQSIGDVAWAQKRNLEEWRTLQKTVVQVCTEAEKSFNDAETLVEGFAEVLRTSNNDKGIRNTYKDAMQLEKELSSLYHDASRSRMIIDGQITLLQCADECATLEATFATLESEVASAGIANWADEKDAQAWRERESTMSGIATRVNNAMLSASALVQKIRPVVQVGNGDVTIAAFDERTKKLLSSISQVASLASGQRTMAKDKAQLVKLTGEYTTLKAELANLKATLVAMEPISWSDEKDVQYWLALQDPATELSAKADKASARASELAKNVKPVVKDSKGDASVAAFDAKVEQLNASISTLAAQAAERLAIAKGQVPLAKFANDCKTMASAIVKVPAAFAKKKSRMNEIGNIERDVRSSSSRNYSDLEELTRKVTEIKARSMDERKDEVALGRNVQELVRNRERIMGANAIYRLKRLVPEKSAHARIDAELDAFKRTVGVQSDSNLPGFFTNTETRAYQLADTMDEDKMLNRLEETLVMVQRLAAKQR